MPFFSSSSPFDDDVEKATAANNSTEDWTKIMYICDQIPRSSTGPKDALKSIMKRVNHRIPQVSLQALTLLDACVNNCGKVFHLEVCSRDFVEEVRHSLARIHPTVGLKFKGMIRDWAKTFKDDPQLVLIPTLYEELKRERVEFPDEKTASSIGLSSNLDKQPSKNHNEAEDIALAIQLSLSESEGSKAKTTSLYPSVSSGSSSSSSSKLRKVRALYDFEAAEDNELTFKTGDIITVTDSSDANWWKGDLLGKSGLFPANFVTSDLTPEPVPVKKKNKKKKKKVYFSAKNSVKEFDASKAVSPAPVISEEKIEQCLEMLKNASVDEDEEDDEGLLELEECCKKMNPLVADMITNIQRNQDRLSEVNDSFLQVMETYQKLCQEPIPQARPAPSYAYNTQPNQHSYTYKSYVPNAGIQYHPPNHPMPETMNAQYLVQGTPGQPAYASPLNQPRYVPQQQTVPYQGPGAAPLAQQEYAYTAGQVPMPFQPEQQQYPITTQYQQNYPTAVGPYANDSHPQLITAQSRY